ncbi:hypothetical protein [uncultured Vibrio sp.]|uniref:hypothetical protein n=1 Tax=uncultured Vibrio sp. TaxID=114054 RepID=UPI00260E1F91|nr:hypothetical protein [uncultured Vibrio sp.]
MDKKTGKLNQKPVEALDRESCWEKDAPETNARDWHSMSQEEQLEILSHLSDMPFQ